mgnify:CR=1 FL=1
MKILILKLFTRNSQLIFSIILELILIIPFLALCLISRFLYKRYCFGIGPEPLINNINFKKSFDKLSIKSQTFVTHTDHITSSFDKNFKNSNFYNFIIIPASIKSFLYSIFNFRALLIYFNGGPLFNTYLLRKYEHYFYKIANLKIVVLPYGGDVQDLTRTNNLIFKNGMNQDYPQFKFKRKSISKNIEKWTNNADFVVSGCDWVDFMFGWDMLLPAHFTVDLPSDKNIFGNRYIPKSKLRILHASNHRGIKGTNFIIETVKKLQEEYELDIHLQIIEKANNEEVKDAIKKCDLVIDQIIIGWYGLFSLEAMAYSKPVVCFLRNDLIDFYKFNKVIENSSIENHTSKFSKQNLNNSISFPPIINSNINSLEKILLEIYYGEINLSIYSINGYEYCKKYHSIEARSKSFKYIHDKIFEKE